MVTRLSAAAVIVVAALITVSGQQANRNPNNPGQANRADNVVPGQMLIRFSAATTTLTRNNILSSRNLTRLKRFANVDVDLVGVPPGQAVAAMARLMRDVPGVAAVQPNYYRQAIGTTPNDPLFQNGSLWALEKIQAPAVWSNYTTGDGTVVIASIDTGVNYNHPDLAANMWRNALEVPNNGVDDDGNGYVDDVFGIDTVNGDTNPFDDQGHGTHTAGTIAAVGNNGKGITGINWNAKVLACKFLSAAGTGTDAGAVECFDYILALRNRGVNIRVTNNSWGAPRGSGPPATALQAAIDQVGATGVVNVFGAGNDSSDNDSTPFDPASYASPSIISVASSGGTDRPSFFTNYGPVSVDLAAPGEDILSTYLGTGYEYSSGTSMATPHVAGVAALLAKLDPSLSAEAIRAYILESVDLSPHWSGLVLTGGRLNARKAAELVGTGNSNSPPSVSLVHPLPGAVFKAPVDILVEAAASDSDGSVERVSFFANGVLIGEDTSAPYSITWGNVAPGTYSLKAVASDDRFGTGTSPLLQVVVNDNLPPIVSLTAPAGGASFTSPALVTIEATASDPDGGVQQVEFFANGVSIGVDTLAPYSLVWSAPVGSYALKAVATDNGNTTAPSGTVNIVVNPLPGRINVALAANGGLAAASSTYGPKYPATATNNGDRKGLKWGNGGGWNDATQNQTPDWLEISFKGQKLIEEVNIFSMQDNYTSPLEPTASMAFTLWGLRNFEVQYWTGTGWTPVPNGTVVNNNLVWRKVVFSPLVTTKIRAHITGPLNGFSRMIEMEAWGVAAGANTPPTVTLTSPVAGTTFTSPATIIVEAAAEDADGGLQRVDFLANGALIGTATSAPFTITWSGVSSGSYSLTAIATDSQGAETTSAAVSIAVTTAEEPPTVPGRVNMAAAANGGVATASSVLNASYGPTGAINGDRRGLNWGSNGGWNDGTPNASPDWIEVQFSGLKTIDEINVFTLQDNYSSPVDPTPALTFSLWGPRAFEAQYWTGAAWVTVPGGSISNNNLVWRRITFPALSTTRVRVLVNQTLNGYTRLVEVEAWGTTANTPPEVSLTSPADGASFVAPAAITLSADATDVDGTVASVEFFVNGSSAGTATGPFTLPWNNVGAGSYVITAVARDNQGATTTSASRTISVTTNAPPTVSITAPANGATFTAPLSTTISAAASDTDGSIASVAFFANGVSLGLVTAAPYQVAWNNVPEGTYTVSALAMDNLGVMTTVTIQVTVNPAEPRRNVALASNGAVASASSTLTPNYPASGAINGDRRGLGWGAGGGWNDGTPNASPDWIEVRFASLMSIDEIGVLTLQDAFSAPAEPTPTMTFSLYGIRHFEIQYWNGTAWVAVPGGVISNNNLVWRRVTFAPVVTDRIRVHITGALNGYSRVVELEAWGVSSGGSQ